ncbi:MAG: DUF1385 domain-containing protein [Anaerolineae bacterium]|nr:DUF1385 domain-containing protein [Anaerolineae bacterium]
MAPTKPKFNYGGQAVMEGVMMRGVHLAAIAVRDPEGKIVVREEKLNSALYRGSISKIPFVRGLIGLWDALGLGTKALIWSANVAAGEDEDFISGAVATGMVVVSLSLGIGLFFILPTAAADGAKATFGIKNSATVETIESLVKLCLFTGYLFLISRLPDVKRLFGYHGAEHKTINAYEAGYELTTDKVKVQSIEHPRCGTAFLGTVLIISIIVGLIVGRPHNFFLLLLSRVALILPIAGLSYEILRFTARHAENPLVKLVITPNLWLQHLTTRQPDDSMIEVAIAALERVLESEKLTKPSAHPAENPSMPLAAMDGSTAAD